jgi:PAT family beta-lactamase induction signal transducer AmpG
MLVALLMGFSCGLPLLLTITVLQAWMKEEGVDLTVIGMMALVGLPYTLKFLWAPFLDRFTLPFLGRRRGWLLVAQAALMVSISGLGFTAPGKSPWMVAVIAFLVTFFSASQDIVVDAYRREDLQDEELGLCAALYVNGFRWRFDSGRSHAIFHGLSGHGGLYAAGSSNHTSGPGTRYS